jgi:hypothetical protein
MVYILDGIHIEGNITSIKFFIKRPYPDLSNSTKARKRVVVDNLANIVHFLGLLAKYYASNNHKVFQTYLKKLRDILKQKANFSEVFKAEH